MNFEKHPLLAFILVVIGFVVVSMLIGAGIDRSIDCMAEGSNVWRCLQ